MDSKTKEKVRYEIGQIEILLKEAKPLLDLSKSKEPDFGEKCGIALILHSFYQGVENMASHILKHIEEHKPTGTRWHKSLLEAMFGENSKNIVILRKDLKIQIEKYLEFRHVVRSAYSHQLDWEKMEILVINLEYVWKMIKSDVEMFIKKNEE